MRKYAAERKQSSRVVYIFVGIGEPENRFAGETDTSYVAETYRVSKLLQDYFHRLWYRN